MSTPTLYNINVTLMNLIFEREDIANDPDLTPKEIEQRLKAKDVEIREHVTALVKKVDGVAYVLMELAAHEAAAKAEKERQHDREHAFEARRERLETLVKSVMLMSGKARLEGDANTLRLVKCPPSVEIAQPILVPDEYRKLTVELPAAVWYELLRLAGSFEDVVAQTAKTKDCEPMKSKIAEALKQTEPCGNCGGNGVVEVSDDITLEFIKCEPCDGTGKVSKGVPGCRLVTDKMSLRVE